MKFDQKLTISNHNGSASFFFFHFEGAFEYLNIPWIWIKLVILDSKTRKNANLLHLTEYICILFCIYFFEDSKRYRWCRRIAFHMNVFWYVNRRISSYEDGMVGERNIKAWNKRQCQQNPRLKYSFTRFSRPTNTQTNAPRHGQTDHSNVHTNNGAWISKGQLIEWSNRGGTSKTEAV